MTDSPTELLDRLVFLFPEFAGQWDGPANCFKPGGATYCGVLAEFSHFFRQRFDSAPPETLSSLGDLLSVCMAAEGDLPNAVATCFLENISGEPCARRLRRDLTGEPLRALSEFPDIISD